MARVPMLVAFAVRRAATATTAAGKAMWEAKGVLIVGGAAVAAWVYRADLGRLADHLFSQGPTHSPLDRDQRLQLRLLLAFVLLLFPLTPSLATRAGHNPYARDLCRDRAKRAANKGARKGQRESHGLYTRNHGGAGSR